MNPLIELKAQLRCFAKALFAQKNGNTVSELGKIICCALLLTLVLRSGAACNGWPGIPGGTPAPGGVAQARTVQFFNCNHDSPGLPAQAYNVYSRVDSGNWVPRGGLNPTPDPWANPDCKNDPAHQGASLTLDLFAIQPGKWEFRLIKLHREGEPDCDSSAPEVKNACLYLSEFFQAVSEAPPVIKEETSP